MRPIPSPCPSVRWLGLHPIRHFVGVDPGCDFAIASDVEPFRVEPSDGVDHRTLVFFLHPGRGGEIEDRIAVIAKRNSLIRGRQPAAPEDCTAVRPARSALQHDETGKIARFAAESVSDP